MSPPLSRDPAELLVLLLDPPQRRALYGLLTDISAHMRAQLRPREPAAGPERGAEKGAVRPMPMSARVIALRTAAVRKLDEWRDDALKRARPILEQRDDDKIRAERTRRRSQMTATTTATAAATTPRSHPDLIELADGDAHGLAHGLADPADDVALLQTLYRPFPTSLTNELPPSDRSATILAILLLLLSAGAYSAYSRVLLLHLAASLQLPLSAVAREEVEAAAVLLDAAAGRDAAGPAAGMSADTETARRREQNKASRFWKVGLASVAGAAVIGITGGLAAPVVAGAIGGIMGGVGLGGMAGVLGVFWMNAALVGTLFGAYGAKMTGEMMDKYAREVEDFAFVPLDDVPPATTAADAAKTKSARRLRLTIGVNGWLTSKDDIARPWRPLVSAGSGSEVYALRYELAALMSLGDSLRRFASSYAWGTARNQILQRTVLASVWGAVWPAAMLTGAASVVDNPFGHAMNRSGRAGRILADALAARVQGERPVTLVGFSLGAAVVCACLEELARRRVFGVVESVVLVGAPAGSGRDYWEGLASVVAGRIHNVYSERDYILGFLYRTYGLRVGIAGLQVVGPVDRVENLNLTGEVNGHLRYPDLMPQILTRCGFPAVDGGCRPIERDDEGPEEAPESEAAEKKDVLEESGPKAAPSAAVSTSSGHPDGAGPATREALAGHISRGSISGQGGPPPPPKRRWTANPGPGGGGSSGERMILGLGRVSLDGRPLPGSGSGRGGASEDPGPRPRPGRLERIASSFDYTHTTAEQDEDYADEEFVGIRMVDRE